MVAESAKEGFAPTVSGVTVGLQSLGYISHANQLAWTCFKSSKQLVELGILLWLLSEWRHHSRPKKKTQSASSPYPSECLRPSKKKKIFSKTRQTFIAAETPSTIFSPRQIKMGQADFTIGGRLLYSPGAATRISTRMDTSRARLTASTKSSFAAGAPATPLPYRPGSWMLYPSL